MQNPSLNLTASTDLSGTARPPVNFTLTNSNALELLAGFSRAARAAGWTEEQINETVNRAMQREYPLLQCTLAAYTTEYLAGN
jgi:hypothetical protein